MGGYFGRLQHGQSWSIMVIMDEPNGIHMFMVVKVPNISLSDVIMWPTADKLINLGNKTYFCINTSTHVVE